MTQDCRDPGLGVRKCARIENSGCLLPGTEEKNVLLITNRNNLYLYIITSEKCIRIRFEFIRDEDVTISASDRQFRPGTRIICYELKMI